MVLNLLENGTKRSTTQKEMNSLLATKESKHISMRRCAIVGIGHINFRMSLIGYAVELLGFPMSLIARLQCRPVDQVV